MAEPPAEGREITGVAIGALKVPSPKFGAFSKLTRKRRGTNASFTHPRQSDTVFSLLFHCGVMLRPRSGWNAVRV